MGKKDLLPNPSLSILLNLPEGVDHQAAAEAFLLTQTPKRQALFFNPEEETVSIDLIRQLLKHSSFARAASEPQALVVCAAHTATLPAQNALLKLLEEPPAHTQLILTVQPGHQLLPTIVSRCREILWTETASSDNEAVENKAESDYLTALNQFLRQPTAFSYADLVKLAESFKDRETATQTFRTALQNYPISASEPTDRVIKQNLLGALEALGQNLNVKLTLEHYFFAIRKQTEL